MDTKTIQRKAKLRELVAAHNGPSAFSRIIGKTRSYVSQLMSEDYPGGHAAFARLAEAAGLPSNYFDLDDAEHIVLPESKRIPLLRLEEAGSQAMTETNKTASVPLDVEGQFAVRIAGDSMVASGPGEVSLPHGTVVVVDTGRTPMAGNFVLARLPNSASAIVRQLIDDEGFFYLRPLNSRYTTSKVQPDNIVGVVTFMQASLV